MITRPIPRRLRETQSVRDVLKKASGRLMATGSKLARVRSIYRAVVGPDEAATSLVLGVDGDRLVIAVANREAIKRLHLHEYYLMKMIRERCSDADPKECHYKLYPGLGTRRADVKVPPKRREVVSLSAEDRQRVEQTSALVSDPELRRRFAECMASALNLED